MSRKEVEKKKRKEQKIQHFHHFRGSVKETGIEVDAVFSAPKIIRKLLALSAEKPEAVKTAAVIGQDVTHYSVLMSHKEDIVEVTVHFQTSPEKPDKKIVTKITYAKVEALPAKLEHKPSPVDPTIIQYLAQD